MNGWDQRYAKVRDGFEMAEKSIDLGYHYPTGFVAFFKVGFTVFELRRLSFIQRNVI